MLGYFEKGSGRFRLKEEKKIERSQVVQKPLRPVPSVHAILFPLGTILPDHRTPSNVCRIIILDHINPVRLSLFRPKNLLLHVSLAREELPPQHQVKVRGGPTRRWKGAKKKGRGKGITRKVGVKLTVSNPIPTLSLGLMGSFVKFSLTVVVFVGRLINPSRSRP